MSAFTHLPLGQRIPASLHGVSASLPTMRDVIGYEERDPATTRHLTSGYPRFVVHPFAKQAGAHLLRTLGLAEHDLWLTSSIRAAEQLRSHLGEPAALLPLEAALTGVVFPANAELSARAKTFLQHTGMFLSSREAEDILRRQRASGARTRRVKPGDVDSAAACVLLEQWLREHDGSPH